MLVERLGKFHQVANSGLNILVAVSSTSRARFTGPIPGPA